MDGYGRILWWLCDATSSHAERDGDVLDDVAVEDDVRADLDPRLLATESGEVVSVMLGKCRRIRPRSNGASGRECDSKEDREPFFIGPLRVQTV